MIAGSNSTASSHNDRYDNFAVLGTSIAGAGVDNKTAYTGGYIVYPNPAADFVNIASTSTEDKVITIYNMAGQMMSETKSKDIQTIINTSSLNAGIYIVEIKETSTGNKYSVKISKE
jgi:hypothetical protein